VNIYECISFWQDPDNESLKIRNQQVLSACGVRCIYQILVVLVAGSVVPLLLRQRRNLRRFSKVLLADNIVYEHQLPENIAELRS